MEAVNSYLKRMSELIFDHLRIRTLFAHIKRTLLLLTAVHPFWGWLVAVVAIITCSVFPKYTLVLSLTTINVRFIFLLFTKLAQIFVTLLTRDEWRSPFYIFSVALFATVICLCWFLGLTWQDWNENMAHLAINRSFFLLGW